MINVKILSLFCFFNCVCHPPEISIESVVVLKRKLIFVLEHKSINIKVQLYDIPMSI